MRATCLLVLCVLCLIPASYGVPKPSEEEWVQGSEPEGKELLLDWLLDADQTVPVERPAVDGFFNNPFMPEQGAFDTRMLRRSAAQYADGVFEPSGKDRPNPFVVSRLLMSDDESSPGSVSKTGKTALLVFFGQQFVEEVLDAQKAHCPPEYLNIPLPEESDENQELLQEKLDLYDYRKRTKLDVLPFLRTRYDAASGFGPNNPRQQLNELTPYIDGNLMYGTSPAWTDFLRRFANGTVAPNGQLAWSEELGPRFPAINEVNLPMFNPPPPTLHQQFARDHQTLPAARHFMLGNPRGNENPMLLSFGILWYRWHNAIAKKLAEKHTNWGSDQLFEAARKWVVASYQHLSTNTWLPEWLGVPLPPYNGYNSSVNPQIDHMFQTAAMRFGHTLVPSGVYMRNFSRHGCDPIPVNIVQNGDRHSTGVRTCNSFWRPQDVLLQKITVNGQKEVLDIDRFFMGMATQMSEREDHLIVQDLRGFVFGPMEFSRRDLMAVNIQRGRDHGVSDYDTARKSMGLEPITTVDDYMEKTGTEVPREIIERLFELYGNRTGNMDLWPAGLLETALNPGPLFRSVLIDQFARIRAADRFWYKNYDNGLFTKEEVARLEQLTIYDVIMSVTRMERGDLQANPFLAPSDNLDGQMLSSQCMQVLSSHKMNTCIRQATLREVIDHSPAEELAFNCLVFNQTHLDGVNSSNAVIENCTQVETYWYFDGSQVPFGIVVGLEVLTAIGAVVIVVILLKIKRGKDQSDASKPTNSRNSSQPQRDQMNTFIGTEWLGPKEGSRNVQIIFNDQSRKLEVHNETLQLVRTIDLGRHQPFQLIKASDKFTVVLKLPKEYDLVIKCSAGVQRNQFLQCWTNFLSSAGLQEDDESRNDLVPEKEILTDAVTYQQRRKRLQKFFRYVFIQAQSNKKSQSKSKVSMDIFMMELTREEFAAELRMKSDSVFVTNMFELIDKDKNGTISFREFLDLLIIFKQGSADDKLKLLFDMYDTRCDGYLTTDEFTLMVSSLFEMHDASVSRQQMLTIVNGMLSSVDLRNQNQVTLGEFIAILRPHRSTFQGLELGFMGPNTAAQPPPDAGRTGEANRYQNIRQTLMDIYKPTRSVTFAESAGNVELRRSDRELTGELIIARQMRDGLKGRLTRYLHLLDQHRLEVFWTALHTFILWGVFFDQAYVYAVEREHVGFRQVTGWGVAITRGAASAMMYSFVIQLVSACRNVTTYLRDTILLHYIPFDSAFAFHQYAALWGVFFTAVHTIGHRFNFYYLNTQPAADLACLFRDHYFGTHILPKYDFWLWGTLTGVTGVLLLVQTVAIFVFSLPYVRHRLSRAFWITHNTYPLFYILNLLHGSARLIQRPYFPFWLAGPAALYGVDRLISLSRRRVILPIVKAELLPSGVTKIVIQRPTGFEFRSGHYVRISCPALGDSVYHAFTLSSPPQEKNLSLHVRAVGAWTKRLREEVSKAIGLPEHLPKVYLDGPYGEAHQDWGNYPVTVLIGAGIGITPFASILQDIAHRMSSGAELTCQKVHFLWVTRDQKQFEWMVDLLREVEGRDTARLISTNIFITQFPVKFDIRTVMLYVCERQFQKIEQCSLFTGLRAVTHFGHPDFDAIFRTLKTIHPEVSKFGVFSCGPRPMSRAVEAACRAVSVEGPVKFRHHFENFY